MAAGADRLTVYLSPEEHAAMSASAARAGLSLSTFAKRVRDGMAVPSLEHKQAVLDILKARADSAGWAASSSPPWPKAEARNMNCAACCGKLKPGNAN